MVERYERQVVMPEVGAAGQARLGRSRVLVVGAGGLGSAVLLYLAAAGVGVLGIADDDTVALSNLNRQILYVTDDLGQSKAHTAARRVKALNPDISTMPYAHRVLRGNGPALVRQYDLVVESADDLETKRLVNALCVEAGIPLVWASVTRFEGQMGVYTPGNACRACLFPVLPEPGTYPSAAALGIVGAAAGVMGSLEAVEALKVLLEAGAVLTNRLLLWDGLRTSFDLVSFERHADCPACGGR
jgi:adenylyltransferase/sulfurtransferase